MAHSNTLFFPEDFLSMVRDTLACAEAFDDFIAACHRPLRRSIRVNTLKISVADFLQLVAPYGWQLTAIPWCETGFWLERDDETTLPLGSMAEHLSGLFYIQEASSMLPVAALFNQAVSPSAVLDMAAAPGSKTSQIAANLDNKGVIIANEYSASRVKVLHATLTRLGISNAALTHFDGCVFGAALPEMFDAVLLDAPCSGEGVIRKDPHALRNWSLSSSEAIAETQTALIHSAFHALRPGGTLVYSTCTINPLENQAICLALKNSYPDAVDIVPLNDLFPTAEQASTPEGFLHVFPQTYDCEGFFVAKFRKTASVPALPTPTYKLAKFPFNPVKGREAALISQEADNVGLMWHDNLTLWQRDKEIWLFPQQVVPFIGKIRFSRIGIKLAEQHNKGYRWQHEAVIALAQYQNKYTFALTSQEAEDWYCGRDIYPERDIPHNDVIVTYQSIPIGLARKIGSRLKNSFPRELVRDGKLFWGKTASSSGS